MAATLLQLRTQVRQVANMETSQFITDSELTSYVNLSAFELYDLLVTHYGDDFYVADPYTFTTDGTNDHVALPADFYKLLGVDISLGGNQWDNVPKFSVAGRNKYSNPTGGILYGYRNNIRYRLSGSKLWLTPLPKAGQQLRIFYIPRWTPLSADGDTFDGISGWEEYVIIDSAIKCLQKEESDVSALMAQKQGLIMRIEAAAANRDAGTPARVADVFGMDGDYPGSGYGWGW
jgi:hypothetical protein